MVILKPKKDGTTGTAESPARPAEYGVFMIVLPGKFMESVRHPTGGSERKDKQDLLCTRICRGMSRIQVYVDIFSTTGRREDF